MRLCTGVIQHGEYNTVKFELYTKRIYGGLISTQTYVTCYLLRKRSTNSQRATWVYDHP